VPQTTKLFVVAVLDVGHVDGEWERVGGCGELEEKDTALRKRLFRERMSWTFVGAARYCSG